MSFPHLAPPDSLPLGDPPCPAQATVTPRDGDAALLLPSRSSKAMAEKLVENGRDHRARHRLLRRHTEEEPSTPLRRRQVKRSTSDGERGREDGHCRDEDIASRHPSSLPVPLSSPLEVRARRLAWPVSEPITPSVKQPTENRPGSCVTRPPRHRSTSGVQYSSSLSVTQTHETRREGPEAPEACTWISTGVEIKKVVPASRGSQVRHNHQRLRSDSWPEVTLRGTTRRASLTSLVHTTYRSRLEVEPYDGLTVQRAPLLPGPSKGEALPLSGHEADEESDGEDSDQATQAKPRGYWARGGSTFLPFSKLFTKPRQENEELEVGNSFQQLSQSEQEVINRTRRVLKQRLTSANRRRSNKDDKVQLSIFVSPPADNDHHSSGGEESRSPFFRTSIPIQTDAGDHREGNTQPAEDAYMSSQLVPRIGMRPLSVIRRTSGGRRPAGRGMFRRARRQEVTTMMSQVSPVPSDHESRPERNASQGQGGLLQAILTDAETYAANRESRTSVSNRVRRGRR